jgi:hypothetical protein
MGIYSSIHLHLEVPPECKQSGERSFCVFGVCDRREITHNTTSDSKKKHFLPIVLLCRCDDDDDVKCVLEEAKDTLSLLRAVKSDRLGAIRKLFS